MLKPRGVAFFRGAIIQRIQMYRADGRHQQDVAVVGDAGATQMRVAETVDDRIGVVVTGTAVPAGESRVRAELDHAERARGARIRVTMTAGAHEWIYIAREILLRRDWHGRQEQ